MTATPTAESFRPTAADFDHVLHGVPVAYFASGDLIAYTTARPQAVAALNEYLRADEGDVDERLLELRWIVFERQPAGAEHAWIAGLATESTPGAVQAHWLFAHA